MHRFYISPSRWNPDNLALDAEEAHHALDVLRLNKGERITVFNGRGSEATVEIVEIGKGRVGLKRIQLNATQPLPCRITLGQAIPKGKNMDLIVQKATELGVASIAPLVSDRTIVRIEPGEAESKQEKWTATVIEAAKQCGQNWLPEVQPPRSLKDFFREAPRYEMMLIASLQPDAIHPKAVLREVREALGNRDPKDVLVLVGPEGDFTPAELGLAKSSGCRPVSLGPVVLRTETAAFYTLSILSYELQFKEA